MGTPPGEVPLEVAGGDPLTDGDIYETVAGRQILKDAADIWAIYKDRQLTQEGLEQQSEQSQRDYEEDVRQAEQDYALDVKRVGIQEADSLYRQKVGDANGRLQTHQAKLRAQGFRLDQNKFNASQRQAKAAAELDVLDMLARRKGPQDWVAYNNLLGGLNAPSPTASTTIDPFARLEGLFEESTLAPPAVPEWESVQVPIGSPPAAAAAASSAPEAGVSLTFPSAPTGTAPIRETTIEEWNRENPVAAPAAKTPRRDQYSSPPPGATPLKHAEHGGYGDNMVVAGDDSDGEENQELAMSASPITIIPIENDSMRGKAPHMESGGTYGTALNDNTITEQQYSPADLGNQPFIRKLFGQQPSRQFGQFGATLSNPKIGIQNAPFGFNMQNYNALQASEKDMTRSLYEQGLATDFRDVLGSSRRAAPTGQRFGPAFWGG